MTSPSSAPILSISRAMRSDPNSRIRSSSSDRKKRDAPGSPWRPDAAAQLAVDAARLVALGADDVQAADS